MKTPIALDYIRSIIEEEFFPAYLHFIAQGTLHYELTNILELCVPLLEGLEENDRFLRYELTEIIAEYLLED